MAAVLFADLDRFEVVNDSHGHDFGDRLLVAVARRLSHLVRPGDTLARVSGDEFVFLCEDLRDVADAEMLAQRIGDELSLAYEPVVRLADGQVQGVEALLRWRDPVRGPVLHRPRWCSWPRSPG